MSSTKKLIFKKSTKFEKKKLENKLLWENDSKTMQEDKEYVVHKNKIDSVIEDYYSLSNVETSDLIGIDLSNYGYNTEDSNRSKR